MASSQKEGISLKELEIQNQIRVELSKLGLVFRTNSGVAYTKQGTVINLLPKGFPDLLFFGFNGIVAFIECKNEKGKLRPEQENFLNLVKKYGYRAGVAKSAEEALKIIEL